MTSRPDVSSRLAAHELEPVYRRLAERVEAGDVPGAALAVGDAQGPIMIETFAAGSRKAIDPGSFFFLASVTKPIFATAVMQLVEQGLLDMHAPVARYLPAFATPDKTAVTTWHLLTHTSGVADVPTDVIRRQRPSAKRMTQLVSSSPLRFPPGRRWEYGSASFYVLGELIHKLSGLPYPRYLRERLFEPLDIHHITFDPRRRGRPLVPVHGVGADNRLKRFLLLRYVVSIAQPGGGLWGTLEDVVRFGAALLRPRRHGSGYLPLAPETVELMSRDHVQGVPGLVGGEERAVHFGLSWGKPTLMGDAPGSERVMGHGGATGTRLWIDPDAELVFVYFTDQWDPTRTPEFEALRGTYEILARR